MSQYGLTHGDLSTLSLDAATERRRIRKGKAREDVQQNETVTEHVAEEPNDPEAEKRALKAIEENLRRMSATERNRRANKRRQSPTISIQPPLVDLSRKGTQLLRRTSKSTGESSSRKSSVESLSNGPAYEHISRSRSIGNDSLAGLEEGFEEAPTSPPPTATSADEPAPERARPLSKSSIDSAKAAGSRFVEELDSPLIIETPRPALEHRGQESSYSLRTLATSVSAVRHPVAGFYSEPMAQESTAYLTRHDSSAYLAADDAAHGRFGAGFRAKEYSVPWYEAVFCCACWSEQDSDVEAQTGATMPSLSGL